MEGKGIDEINGDVPMSFTFGCACLPTMVDFGLDLVDCLLLWTEVGKMKLKSSVGWLGIVGAVRSNAWPLAGFLH